MIDVVGALSAYTVTDGMMVGSWCGWMAWNARELANALRARNRPSEEATARWSAAGFSAVGAALFYLGWTLEPEGGPTAWSGIAALAWGLGWANLRHLRKTGKPLL